MLLRELDKGLVEIWLLLLLLLLHLADDVGLVEFFVDGARKVELAVLFVA